MRVRLLELLCEGRPDVAMDTRELRQDAEAEGTSTADCGRIQET